MGQDIGGSWPLGSDVTPLRGYGWGHGIIQGQPGAGGPTPARPRGPHVSPGVWLEAPALSTGLLEHPHGRGLPSATGNCLALGPG